MTRASSRDNDAISLSFGGLDDLIGYRLRRAQGAAHRDYMETVAGLRLTQKQTGVLWLVQCNPGVAQGAIGAALGMDRATTMAVVDRLEGRNLLFRKPSTVDARRRELHATPMGERLLVRVKERIAVHEARMKACIGQRELTTLSELLGRLQGGLD